MFMIVPGVYSLLEKKKKYLFFPQNLLYKYDVQFFP